MADPLPAVSPFQLTTQHMDDTNPILSPLTPAAAAPAAAASESVPTSGPAPQKAPRRLPRDGKLRIGITEGDINGVGLELILKAFAEPEMLNLCAPVIYGHTKVLSGVRKALNLETPFSEIITAVDAETGTLSVINCSDTDYAVHWGKAETQAGTAAREALERATGDLAAGRIDALVTAPVNKATIQSDDFRFTGHTEYLESRLADEGREALMILSNELVRVALVTTHLPISEVAFAITQERIERKATLLYETLQRDYGLTSPRIAVLGLNPHCGDDGLIGHEEQEYIIPAIESLREAGVPCFGPFPADGFFGAGSYRQFDAVLAMYHDQGLAPLKALSMEGVNYTAGLTAVRTSPDHGTAYDIAGRGIADPASLRQAIYAAIDIVRHRDAYDAAHADPLPKIYQSRRER